MANKKPNIGGQAVIEGVMMRGPTHTATVVRKPDGNLTTKVEGNNSLVARLKVGRIPLARGVITFVDSIMIGMRTLMYSAEVAIQDDEKEQKKGRFEEWLTGKFGDKGSDLILYAAVFIGLLLSIAIFFLLPNYILFLFKGIMENRYAAAAVEGGIRLLLFFGYIMLISNMKDIKRVFMYHGAEHKTIFCYEKGLPLTPANARSQSRLHPRCGTSFLFIVMILSIFIFFFIPSTNIISRTVYRLLLLPVVAGLSYEVIRFSGRYDNALTRVISAPGMALQYFTTREPDDAQLETAIEAIKAVVDTGE